MSDGDALLRAILEYPAEDTPRLVYADWLQENGDEEQAEFIRVQVGLSHRVPLLPEGDPERDGEYNLWERLRSGMLDSALPCLNSLGIFPYWIPSVGQSRCGVYVRGFVSEICLPLAAFMKHAPALFAAHPIERVTLTDRESRMDFPYDEFPWFTWFPVREIWVQSERWDVPIALAGRKTLIRFNKSEDADAWLSARCVAYGRKLAGLSKMHTAA